MSEVNRERSRLTAASSVYDLTKHNGLVTPIKLATNKQWSGKKLRDKKLLQKNTEGGRGVNSHSMSDGTCSCYKAIMFGRVIYIEREYTLCPSTCVLLIKILATINLY